MTLYLVCHEKEEKSKHQSQQPYEYLIHGDTMTSLKEIVECLFWADGEWMNAEWKATKKN